MEKISRYLFFHAQRLKYQHVKGSWEYNDYFSLNVLKNILFGK